MWRLFQVCIIGGVMASNVHWNWTPNPYLAGLLGVIAAYLATLVISKSFDGLRILRAWKRQNASH